MFRCVLQHCLIFIQSWRWLCKYISYFVLITVDNIETYKRCKRFCSKFTYGFKRFKTKVVLKLFIDLNTNIGTFNALCWFIISACFLKVTRVANRCFRVNIIIKIRLHLCQTLESWKYLLLINTYFFRVTGGELFEDIVAREYYSESDARYFFFNPMCAFGIMFSHQNCTYVVIRPKLVKQFERILIPKGIFSLRVAWSLLHTSISMCWLGLFYDIYL